jgi:hypothetical protein
MSEIGTIKMIEEVDTLVLMMEELEVDTLTLIVEVPVADTLALIVEELVGMKLVLAVVAAVDKKALMVEVPDNIRPFVIVRPLIVVQRMMVVVVVEQFHLEAGKDHVEEKQDQLEYLA